MKDLNWMYMLDVLSGEKFSNLGLQKMAEINIGAVKECKQYTLLTNRLYEENWRDRFLAK